MNFKNFNRYVEVRGLDEKVVKSDKAVWSVNFSAATPDMQQTYRQIADAKDKVVNFLKQQGFDENSLQIQSISIMEDLYSAGNKPDGKPIYRAQTGVIVSSSDVNKIAASVQKTSALVEAGVIVSDSRARYFYTQLNSIKPEMLTNATANAKEAANTFAVNTQSKLGKIRHATQGLFTITAASGGGGYDDEASVMKNVRVVTSVEFFLQD